MTAESDDYSQIDRLISALIEDVATEEQVAELEALLANDRASRRRYIEYAELVCSLRQRVGTRGTPSPAPSGADTEVESDLGCLEELDGLDGTNEIEPQPGPRAGARWARAAAAAAVVACVALVSWTLLRSPQGVSPGSPEGDASGSPIATRSSESVPESPDVVGVVTHATGAKWTDSSPESKAGPRHIHAGELRLDEGRLQMQFLSGATVLLQGPALVEIESPWRIHLLDGTLTARVPPSAVGFVVNTPSASIVDLGTEFGVRAEGGATRLHVFEGSVRYAGFDEDGSELARDTMEEGRALAIDRGEHAGVWNPDARSGFSDDAVIVGRNVGWASSGKAVEGGLSQILDSTLQADAEYVLNVRVGNPLYNKSDETAPYRLELWAGDVLVASDTGDSPPANTWESRSLTYVSGPAPSQLGQPLEVRLIATSLVSPAGGVGYEVDFDEVSLSLDGEDLPILAPGFEHRDLADGMWVKTAGPSWSVGFYKTAKPTEWIPVGHAKVKPIRVDRAAPPRVDASYSDSEHASLPIPDSYVTGVLSKRPTIYWRFEEVSDESSIRNWAGTTYQGRLIGGVAVERLPDSNGNHALRFGGDKGQRLVLCSEAVAGLNSSEYSMELWLLPARFQHATLVSAHESRLTRMRGAPSPLHQALALIEITSQQGPKPLRSNSVRFAHRWPPSEAGGSGVASRDYIPGKWSHLVATKTGSHLTLYLDSEVIDRVPIAPNSSQVPFELVLGQLDKTRDVRRFVGIVDEFALYPRALTRDEVREHFELVRGSR